MTKKRKASKPKQPIRRKHQKKSWKNIFMVGALLLAMIAFILSSMPNFKSVTKAPKTSQTSTSNASSTSLNFKKEGELTFFKADGTTPIQLIDIEVAGTDQERQQGMMHRRFMAQGTGMLFPSDRDEPQSFWMKNTYVALDIIYIKSDKTIVSMHKNAQPLSEASLPSTEDAQYVLEVPGGYCDTQGIGIGDKVDFTIF